MYMICMLKTSNADERNQRPKLMERHATFMDWKMQHGNDVSFA